MASEFLRRASGVSAFLSFMRNFSIRTRLLAFGALGIVLVLVVGAAGMVGIRGTGGAARELAATTTRIRLQGDVDMMHDAIRADVYEALVSAERAGAAREQFTGHVAAMRASLEGELGMAPDAAGRAELEAAGVALDAYVAMGGEILSRAAEGDRAAAMERVPAFQAAFERLGVELEAVTDRIEAGAASAQSGAGESARLATVIITAATALAVVAMLVLAGLMTRNIVAPLREAVASTAAWPTAT